MLDQKIVQCEILEFSKQIVIHNKPFDPGGNHCTSFLNQITPYKPTTEQCTIAAPRLLQSFLKWNYLPSLHLKLTRSSSSISRQPWKNLPFIAKASSQVSQSFTPSNDESKKAKLKQVAKRLEKAVRYFKRLGGLGFWGQLVCTVVAAVILSFSVVVTRKVTSPTTFYATTCGIVVSFIFVFWSFGYILLSEKLRRTANDPTKAPPQADVVKGLKNGIILLPCISK